MAGKEVSNPTVFIDANGVRFSRDGVAVLPSAQEQRPIASSVEQPKKSVKSRQPVILQMTDDGTVEKKSI